MRGPWEIRPGATSIFKALSRFEKRLQLAFLIAAATIFVPLAVVLLAEQARLLIGPGDRSVILWWPDTDRSGIFLLFFASVLTAVVLGILMMVRELRGWWRRARWPWLVLGVFALGLIVFSIHSSVLVYPDRLVATGFDREGYWEETYSFRTAESVEVRCVLQAAQSDRPDAVFRYRVHFPYGTSYDLAAAKAPRGPRTQAARIEALAKLDAAALKDVPHQTPEEWRSVNCIRALRRGLPPADFDRALRMLGISQADFMRDYAEPHETWRREPTDAR